MKTTRGGLGKGARPQAGASSYDCGHCQKSFTTKQAHMKHERAHRDDNKRISCAFCDKVLKSRGALARHVRGLRGHTGERPYPCTDCSRAFCTSGELSVHKNKHHVSMSTKQYTCHICQRIFSSAINLRDHMVLKHVTEPPVHSCIECGQSFKLLRYLRSHQAIHLQVPVEPQKCTFCPATFKNSSGRTRHIRKHTGEKPHVCPNASCGTRFLVRANMMAHFKRIHLNEKPHKCQHCAKRFAPKAHLLSHMRTHTGENPFECDVCNKSFSLKSNFKRHIMTHVAEKPYLCPECGRSFKSNKGLRGRMQTFHGPAAGAGTEKRQCKICQKIVTAMSLREHLKIHNRDDSLRPFACEICAKTYYTKRDLKVHILGHGPKTQVCMFCNKTFHTRKYLALHLRIHTGEKPVMSRS